MKLLLIPALLLATAGPSVAVRFEADGVRVGSELITGASVSLRESGALPLLVSGSVVESLSGESLAVVLGDKQALLGAGLRIARTADGYVLSTHGTAFSIEAAGSSLRAERSAAFKVTETGFDFGALGTIEGSSFAAKVAAAIVPVAAVAPQETTVSPEKEVRQGRVKVFRRLYGAWDPTLSNNSASGVALRQITRVTPDAAP
jgi:hypothetical protein